VSVSVAQWYPKGRDYIFVCDVQGFIPTVFDWQFGNGEKQLNANKDVYYTYPSAGSYDVTCTAKSATNSKSGILHVDVQ
jgi:PKD repeat protein